MRSDSDIQKDR